MLAPILLFAYNRPRHLQHTVEALAHNPLAQESELFVFSDGARTEDDREDVELVRSYIHTIEGFKTVHRIERDRNYGLAANIIDGVTDIVNRYGRVIVLEDDLVTAPGFLQFMNDALDTYADEPRVGHIQAYDFTQNPRLPETFLIKFTGSWGWATWQRAWQHFNPDGQYLLNELHRRHLTRRFDFNGKYGFTRMLRHQVEGKNNSWAIRWNASLFLQDILSLNVGRSLVQNEGFDGSGTHCGADHLYEARLYKERLRVEKISPVTENLEARKIFERYYARTNSLWAKGMRRLQSLLKTYCRH
ncbi:putative uncharacterized protein [Prevotella sp. CAG:617]|nr:putative uncharacterized protein [Prevotella sp. CAG:617]